MNEQTVGEACPRTPQRPARRPVLYTSARRIFSRRARALCAAVLIGTLAAVSLQPAAAQTVDTSRDPFGLSVGLVDGVVTLDWRAPAADAAAVTEYQILRRRPGVDPIGVFDVIAERTGSTSTIYRDRNADEAGAAYTYRVKAWRGEELSGWSGYARIDLPAGYEPPGDGDGDPPVALRAVTLPDDDPILTILSNTVSITEGEAFGFRLIREGSVEDWLNVTVEVSERGRFVAPRYIGSRSVFLHPDLDSVHLYIPTVDDDIAEPDGSMTVTLHSGAGYTLGSSTVVTVGLTDNDDGVPIVTAAAGTATVAGLGAVSVTGTASDPDGDALTYAWTSSGGGSFDDAGALSTTWTAPAATDSEQTITLTLTATDASGLAGTATATVTVAESAYGAPTIEGIVGVGHTLSASTAAIAPAGGGTGPYDYQWIRVDSTSGTEIAGATGATYTLTDDDIGHTIKVQVTFTHGGRSHTVASAATETVPTVVTILVDRHNSDVIDGTTVEGGFVVFLLVRQGDPTGSLSATVDLTVEGDFLPFWQPMSHTATFAAGETAAVLVVETVDDDVDEANGSLTLTAREGAGYTAGSPATVIVADNDNGAPIAAAPAA